jgi:hypothetical protein
MVSARKDDEDRDDLEDADEAGDLDDAEDLDDSDEQDYGDDYVPQPALPGWAVFWNKARWPLAFLLLSAVALGLWLPLRTVAPELGGLALLVAGFSALVMFALVLLARFQAEDFVPPPEDDYDGDDDYPAEEEADHAQEARSEKEDAQ